MTQTDLNREVAICTGESVTTIRRRGFSLVEISYPPPQVLDWDKLDERRVGLLPNRQQQHRSAARG